jgi:Tol biopolymer transport system component
MMPTISPPMELHFSWSPDGSRIALTNGHVFIVNKDGSGLEQITTYPVASEGAISWLK